MQAYPFFSVVIQDFLSFGYCDTLKDGLACTVKVFRTTLFLSTASLSGLHISHNNNSKGQPCSKTNKECMGIWTSNLLLWATPMSTVLLLLTINHYQRMQHHFCLIANCLQLGIHQLIIYFKSQVYLAYTGNYQGAKYTPARGILPCCRCHLPSGFIQKVESQIQEHSRTFLGENKFVQEHFRRVIRIFYLQYYQQSHFVPWNKFAHRSWCCKKCEQWLLS